MSLQFLLFNLANERKNRVSITRKTPNWIDRTLILRALAIGPNTSLVRHLYAALF